jgi:hypothetical protein
MNEVLEEIDRSIKYQVLPDTDSFYGRSNQRLVGKSQYKNGTFHIGTLQIIEG